MPCCILSSWSWVPLSATPPLASTLMTSAFLIVLSLCATTIIVQFFSCKMALITFWISSSFLPSRDAVASSRIKILGFKLLRASARAMASRCLWPPLTWQPLSPKERVRLAGLLVSYTSPAFTLLIKPNNCSLLIGVGIPTLMLASMVSSNNSESCPTYPTLWRIEDVWKSLMSRPPKVIVPFCWS